ncbi:DUF6479 family protein, partial [Streptomyces sp. NPDC127066]|uniref:DUF6479 family protein n=1 Tax=Streptomyces sp. NPDC127066 TaxID=3347125 RepID=UPI00364F944D
MNRTRVETAMTNAAVGALGAFTGGLVVVAVLARSVRLGTRVRRRESGPPGPHEHPRTPEGGPAYGTSEAREPDEVSGAKDGRERLIPHRLHSSGSKRGEDRARPRRTSEPRGSFGRGGPDRRATT